MLANGQEIKELWHVPTGSLLSGGNDSNVFTHNKNICYSDMNYTIEYIEQDSYHCSINFYDKNKLRFRLDLGSIKLYYDYGLIEGIFISEKHNLLALNTHPYITLVNLNSGVILSQINIHADGGWYLDEENNRLFCIYDSNGSNGSHEINLNDFSLTNRYIPGYLLSSFGDNTYISVFSNDNKILSLYKYDYENNKYERIETPMLNYNYSSKNNYFFNNNSIIVITDKGEASKYLYDSNLMLVNKEFLNLKYGKYYRGLKIYKNNIFFIKICYSKSYGFSGISYGLDMYDSNFNFIKEIFVSGDSELSTNYSVVDSFAILGNGSVAPSDFTSNIADRNRLVSKIKLESVFDLMIGG